MACYECPYILYLWDKIEEERVEHDGAVGYKDGFGKIMVEESLSKLHGLCDRLEKDCDGPSVYEIEFSDEVESYCNSPLDVSISSLRAVVESGMFGSPTFYEK